MAIKRKIVRGNKPVASEVPVTTPVTTPAPVRTPAAAINTTSAAPAPVTTVVDGGGKFRRLKDNGVVKVKRFERGLSCSDRDTIIRWWNENQRLVPENDSVCVTLTNAINNGAAESPLSSMQVAGYLSHLCRLGKLTHTNRQVRISRTVERGDISIIPAYTRPLLNAIIENWERERQDEALRAQAHAQMRAARAEGRRLRIRSGDGVRVVMQPVQTPVRATVVPAEPTEETFDIKWM